MNVFAAIFVARSGVLLQYRAAALAGLGTQVFWGFIRIAIFTAFYAGSSPAVAEAPLSLVAIVGYVWLTQATLRLLPWEYDPDVQKMVRTGDVAYELLRPIDVYTLWFARALAARVVPVLLRGVPMFALTLALFGMQPPSSCAAGLAFLGSLALAMVLSAAYGALLTISLLYTTSGVGVRSLSLSIVSVFSGSVVPLPLVPTWLGVLAWMLPFRGLMDTPFRCYLGDFTPYEGGLAIGHQLAWIAILVLLGRWLLARALVRLSVQGG